jgi:DNA-binding NarL/FixJ family response regulator
LLSIPYFNHTQQGDYHKIAQGEKYVSPALALQLALEIVSKPLDQHKKLLSEREYQVLGLLAAGKNMTDIAHNLALSMSSVSTYRSRLRKKLGLKTTADLVRYAIQNKLVEL